VEPSLNIILVNFLIFFVSYTYLRFSEKLFFDFFFKKNNIYKKLIIIFSIIYALLFLIEFFIFIVLENNLRLFLFSFLIYIFLFFLIIINNFFKKLNIRIKIENFEKKIYFPLNFYIIKLQEEYIEDKLNFILHNEINKIYVINKIENDIKNKYSKLIFEKYNEFNFEKFDLDFELNSIIKNEDSQPFNIFERIFKIVVIGNNFNVEIEKKLDYISKQLKIRSKEYKYLKEKYIYTEKVLSDNYEYFYNLFFRNTYNDKLVQSYEILGVKESSDFDKIKQAYVTLAKKHHPDLVAHLGEENVKKATEIFSKITDAYDIICKERGC